MKEFGQLLIGSSFVALVAFGSWVIGAVMGGVLVKFGIGRPVQHRDVDELLARQRTESRKAPDARQAAASGAQSVP